ncbi:Probable glycine dehydrogenase (decarboxylating) subunit 2, partial [Geodia barretti]
RAAPAGAVRTGGRASLHQHLAAQLLGGPGLLSAGLLHHEVQPQDQRPHRRPARAGVDPSLSGRGDRAGGAATALGAAGVAGRDRRAARRVAAAVGRRARRADRRAHHSRVPPCSWGRGGRLAAHDDAGARLRARHQPGDRRHGRLPVAHGADRGRRQPGLRGAAGCAGRQRGRAHDHQPQYAGAVRGTRHRHRRRGARGRRTGLYGRRQHERDGRRGAAGDLGTDILHFNLHKTFSVPHGGGGPGAGATAVTEQLARFLPAPVVRRDGETYRHDYDRPDSIGRVRAFYGNVNNAVRGSDAYLRSLGGDGLAAMSRLAVVNGNYVRAALADCAGGALSAGGASTRWSSARACRHRSTGCVRWTSPNA